MAKKETCIFGSEKLNEFLRTLEAFSCQHFRDDLFDKCHAKTCRWFFDLKSIRTGLG